MYLNCLMYVCINTCVNKILHGYVHIFMYATVFKTYGHVHVCVGLSISAHACMTPLIDLIKRAEYLVSMEGSGRWHRKLTPSVTPYTTATVTCPQGHWEQHLAHGKTKVL